MINLNEIEKETVNRYDEIAEMFNKDWRGKHDKGQLKHLNLFGKMIGNPPKKILDAGCGTGKDCVYLASKGYEVYGIDLSHGMLRKALEKSKGENLKMNLSIGDMRLLNFQNNYFDGVWTTAAIIHLPLDEKQKAIREFYRVLKSGGFLHIWVQNLLGIKHLIRLTQSYLSYLFYSNTNIIKKIGSFKGRVKMGYAFLDNRHFFYPTKRSMLKILIKEGFSVLETNHIFSRRLSIYAKK